MTRRDERVHDLLYSCDSRSELCERIADLEEFAREMLDELADYDPAICSRHVRRAQELEVKEES